MNRALLGTACTLAFAFSVLANEKPTTDKPSADKPSNKTTTVTGMIKKVDSSAHMLTVTITTDPNAPKDREFHITKETKFVFFSGDQKKEAVGTNAYKNEQLKEGAKVEVVADDNGKLAEVRVGAPRKKE